MAIVGSAHVIIRAMTDKLQGDIQKGLQGVLPTADAVGGDMGRRLSSGVEQNFSPDMSHFERDMDQRSRRIGDRVGRNIGDGTADGSRRGFRDVERTAGGSGGRSGKNFFSAFNRSGGSRVFTSMALRIAALLPLLAALGGAIGAVVNGLFLMGSAAAESIYSVTALGGALAALVQGAIVGMVAFKGVGEALSAGTKLAAEEAAGSGKDMADAAGDAARAVRNAAEAVADAERNAARAIRDAQRAVRDAKEALARTYTDTHYAMRDAIERTSDAEEARRDAVENLEDAQRALNDAVEEAADRLQDLQFQSREGAIAEQRAVLALQDALYRLNATENLPSDNRTRIEAILAYQEAQLNLEEVQANNQQTAEDLASSQADSAETISDAQEDVRDAQEALSDATRDHNDAIREQTQLVEDNARAIRDMREALQAAREALADAMREGPRSIRDAKEALQEAKEAQDKANDSLAKGTPAANAYATAMSKLSPAAQSFVKYLLSIKGRLQELKFAAQEGVFPGLETAVRLLVSGPMFPALEKMLFRTGKAIGGMARQIAVDLNSGPFQESFGRVTLFNAKLIRQMGRIFGDLAVVILRVLDAARPMTKAFMNWVEGLTSGWRASLSTKDGLENLETTFGKSARTMRQLWRITKNLWEGFTDLGHVGRRSGKGLLRSFEDATKAFANFTDTRKKRQELKETFENTADNLRAIGDLILVIGGSFTRLGANPMIAKTMKDLEPVIKHIEELMTKMLENSGEGLIKLVDRIVIAFQEISDAGAIQVFINILTTAVNLLIGAFRTPVLGTGLSLLLKIGAAMYAISILRKFPGMGLLIKYVGSPLLKRFKTSLMFTRLEMLKLNAQTALAAAKTRVMTAAQAAHSALVGRFPRIARAFRTASSLMFGVWGIAIIGVIAIFVLLYKKVDWFRAAVQFVARKVVDALSWIWEGAKHLLDVLFTHSIFPDIVKGFEWFLGKAEVIFGYVVDVIKFVVKVFTVYVKLWMLLFKEVLAPAFKWFWSHVVQPTFKKIMAFISFAWSVIKFVFKAWWLYITKVLIPVIKFLWTNVVKPVFSYLGKKIKETWDDLIKPSFTAIWNFINDKLIPAAKWLWEKGIKPAFQSIGEKIKNVWENLISPAFESIKSGINKLKTLFEDAKTKITSFWDTIRDKAKAPIRFVIETVLNNGLFKAIGLLPGVGTPHLDLPPGFAQGGVLPGYTPGRDVHRFYSPTGGRLDLSGGEAIMRPEFTRAVGGKAGVDRLNRMARSGALHDQHAMGGVIRSLGKFFLGGVLPLAGADRISQHTSGYDFATWAGDLNSPNDLANPPSQIKAWKSGQVAHTYTGYGDSHGRYGNHIIINHQGQSSLYAHLSSIVAGIAGKMVAGGEMLGRVGQTGNAYGAHLHFEVRGGTVAAGDYGTGGKTSPGEKEKSGWTDAITKFPGAIKGAVSDIRNLSGKFGDWGAFLKDAMIDAGADMTQALNDKIPNSIEIPGPNIPMIDNPLKWPFDQGGVAKGKGWMAKDTIRPERMLNPEQTLLFDRMVRALEARGADVGSGSGDIKLDVHVPHDASARDVVTQLMYELGRLQRGGRYV